MDPPSTQYMSAASTTQQIHPPGEYTLRHPFSFDRYHSHQGLTISSLTHSYPSQQWNTELTEKETTLKQQQGGSMLTKGMTLAWDEAIVVAMTSQPPLSSRSSLPHSKFDQPLPIAGITQLALTRPYRAGLTLLPSALRPHC